MHVQQIQRFGFEDFQHFGGERQRVRRMIKKWITRDLNLMKENVRIAEVHANRRSIADEMNVVAARGQFLAKLGGNDAGAAVRGIAGYADSHILLTATGQVRLTHRASCAVRMTAQREHPDCKPDDPLDAERCKTVISKHGGSGAELVPRRL